MTSRSASSSSLLPVRRLILGAALVLGPALPHTAVAQATCPSPSLPQLAPLSAVFVSALHSVNANVATNVCFVNTLTSAVNVWWIDYGPDGVLPGSPVFYNMLLGGQSYWQGTFVTHPWLITDAATSAPIVGFLPLAVNAEADIGAVPEPAALVLVGTGLCFVAGVASRRRRRN
jgi:hypothetical protein